MPWSLRLSVCRSHLGQLGVQRLGQATRAVRTADLSAHGRRSAAIGGGISSRRAIACYYFHSAGTGREANYYDEHVCLCVCPWACIRKRTSNLYRISVPITWTWPWLGFLWRRCDIMTMNRRREEVCWTWLARGSTDLTPAECQYRSGNAVWYLRLPCWFLTFVCIVLYCSLMILISFCCFFAACFTGGAATSGTCIIYANVSPESHVQTSPNFPCVDPSAAALWSVMYLRFSRRHHIFP